MTPVHDISQVSADFVAAFNSRDLDALQGLYAADAVLVPVPGQPTSGGGILQATEYLISLGSPMQAEVRRAYVAGDLGLLVVDWKVGELSGTATDVVRREGDGLWRYVIDNPHGVR